MCLVIFIFYGRLEKKGRKIPTQYRLIMTHKSPFGKPNYFLLTPQLFSICDKKDYRILPGVFEKKRLKTVQK